MWYLEDGTTEQGKLGYCSIFQVMVLQTGLQSETYCADRQSSVSVSVSSVFSSSVWCFFFFLFTRGVGS